MNSYEFGWNDTIEKDGNDFIRLEPGDYTFEVVKLEKTRSKGAEPCNMAKLTLRVVTADGIADVTTNILLKRTVEWKISQFFHCLGMKKHGEKLVMDWNNVQGKKGRAKFYRRQDPNDPNKSYTDVEKYYDYDPAQMAEPKAEELPW